MNLFFKRIFIACSLVCIIASCSSKDENGAQDPPVKQVDDIVTDGKSPQDIYGNATVDVLIDRLLNHKDPSVRRRALSWLDPSKPGVLPALLTATDDLNFAVRRNVFMKLSNVTLLIKKHELILPVLLERLESPDELEKIKLIVAQSIGSLKELTISHLPKFIDWLKDPSQKTKLRLANTAISAYGKLAIESVPLLLENLENPLYFEFIQYSAKALAPMGEGALTAISILEEMLRLEKTNEVRIESLVYSLGKFRGFVPLDNTIPILLERMISSNFPSVRDACVRFFRDAATTVFINEHTLNVILKVAEFDSVAHVRLSAIRVFQRRINDYDKSLAQFITKRLHQIVLNLEEAPFIRAEALTMYVKILSGYGNHDEQEDSTIINLIFDLIDSPNESAMIKQAALLGMKYAPLRYLKKVSNRLFDILENKESSPRMKNAALESFTKVPTQQQDRLFRLLADLAQNDPNQSVKTKAKLIFIQVAIPQDSEITALKKSAALFIKSLPKDEMIASDMLIKALEHDNPYLRISAIQKLKTLKAEVYRLLPILMKMSKSDKDQEVRLVATFVLSELTIK